MRGYVGGLVVWFAGACLSVPPSDPDLCEDTECEGTSVGATASSTTSTTDTTGGSTSAGASGTTADLGPGSTGAQGFTYTDDELDGEFGAGQFMATRWSGERLELVDGVRQGRFVSRIFDAGTDARWIDLSWSPDAPYGRSLPNLAGADDGYLADEIDMVDNVLLLHFDGTGTEPDGAMLNDASGQGNDATMLAPMSSPSYVEGVVGGALADTADARLSIPVAGAPTLDFGQSDFTWALWARSLEGCAGPDGGSNRAYLGAQAEGPMATHLWMGCLRPTDSTCPARGPSTGRVGGTLSSMQGIDGGSFCTEKAIADGQWHHLALTKSGHPNAHVSVYVDGELATSVDLIFVSPLSMFGAGGDFRLGALSQASTVTLDEVAVWRRALGPDEIGALFRRAAIRLNFQARVCSDPSCGDSPDFLGPNGDVGAFFRDPGTAAVMLDHEPGQFFQYQVSLDTTHVPVDPGSPGLRHVSVRGEY